MEQIIATIAKEHLSFHTLETRRSDSLDFREVAVWCVKAALEAAYKAGFEAGTPSAAKPGTFTLTKIEAAYAIGALRIAYELVDYEERHQMAITGLIDKLAAPLKLDDEIIARLNQPRRRK